MESRSLFFLKRFLRPFSAYRSASTGVGDESFVYRRSMLRRPSTVRRESVPWNSCSFIGTVIFPVKRYVSDLPPAVYTVIEVKWPSCDSSSSSFCRIHLHLSDKLEKVSLKYVKPNDIIYVRGRLGSYKKHFEDGSHAIFYKVHVVDLNFVKRDRQIQKSTEMEISVVDELTVPVSSTADDDKELRDRLHLWQVFFANPYEWWDNRQRKLFPGSADFRHKHTHDGLWLRPDDPSWVRRQLQLYDSNITMNHHSKVHEWEMKDLL
ncbi:protein OSB1, mitochondrial-like isoform X1 [Musa acuminata AAA Group]|uniref:protein OSB1, mitochondrial-like isoform X1 n=1 Tax=Musa acuminata AAA Group TaxID=214697 RepID=UPI0031E415FB